MHANPDPFDDVRKKPSAFASFVSRGNRRRGQSISFFQDFRLSFPFPFFVEIRFLIPSVERSKSQSR